MVATPGQVARLKAGAAGGSDGVKAYDDAQAQVKQGRDRAINSLKGEAAQLGAPGAFTTQLSSQIAQPAATALANLASQGGVERAAAQSNQQANDVYSVESASGLANVRAQDDRDEQQKEALLAAGRAHSAGGSSGGGTLSDSELRTRLMGMAIAARQGQLSDLQNQYALQAKAFDATAPMQSNGEELSGRGSFAAPLTPSAAPLYQQAIQKLQQQKQGLATKANALYGPGITTEAEQLGLQAGLDPGLAAGLFSPQDDASYVNANKSLGLYKDPNAAAQQEITGQTLDPLAAGKRIGLTTQQTEEAYNKQHWTFSDPSSNAYKAISAYVANNPKLFPTAQVDANGKPIYAALTPDEQAAAQLAFRADPSSRLAATNVVSDVLGDAKRAVDSGLDYTTWQSNLMSTPEFRYDPQSFKLGFAQAAPLFQYAAALHSRQTQVQPQVSYDPSALTPTG